MEWSGHHHGHCVFVFSRRNQRCLQGYRGRRVQSSGRRWHKCDQQPVRLSKSCCCRLLSPTKISQCKPFDADGDGYCRPEGVGLVVLKSLTTAVEENDHILGTITSSAVSQSLNRSRITVPDGTFQVGPHRRAIRITELSPNDGSYIEAHGTGTSVWDPIEMSSVREAFCEGPGSSPLYVASMKRRIGHIEASAGVAGLMKILLMMSHDRIPEQASHSSLNPRIPVLEPEMMVIPCQLTPWRIEGRVRCVPSSLTLLYARYETLALAPC
jgi:acyl transferase domain-containing protein